MSEIVVERAAKTAIVTFSRPERRNAMSLGMMRSFDIALADLEDDRDVAVLVLTGAGDKAFGAGLDIREAATLSPAEHSEQHRLYESCQRRLAEFPKPLVAAIEGVAAGASLQMALHCDLIVVAEGARIGMPELSAGRPCILGSYLLSSRLGAGCAARLVLGQDWLDAEAAAACGLAAQVVAPGAALDVARRYADKIAAMAPTALRATLSWLRDMRNGRGVGLSDAFARALAVLPAAASSDEALAASARFAAAGHA